MKLIDNLTTTKIIRYASLIVILIMFTNLIIIIIKDNTYQEILDKEFSDIKKSEELRAIIKMDNTKLLGDRWGGNNDILIITDSNCLMKKYWIRSSYELKEKGYIADIISVNDSIIKLANSNLIIIKNEQYIYQFTLRDKEGKKIN